MISDKTKNPKIIWTEAGKVMMATFSNGKSNVENKQEIANGELPTAAYSGERILVSFIQNEKEKRSTKLSIVK